MSDKNKDVKFIRKNGKVIPIKSKGMNKQEKAEAEGDRHRYRVKHTNTSNYWKGEYFKNAYSRRSAKNFGQSLAGGLVGGYLLKGAANRAAQVSGLKFPHGYAKAGIVGRAALGGLFAYDSVKAMGQSIHNNQTAKRYESMQHDMIRAEMKNQGYKGKPYTRNADLAMAKTVNQFNSQKVKFGYPNKTASQMFRKMKDYN